MSKRLLKTNVIVAALVGFVIGVIVEFFFAAIDRSPALSCLFSPVSILFDLALPLLIGALAAAWASSKGWLSGPSGMLDGAAAAFLAELGSRIIGFCASLVIARSFFFGPRLLTPSVGPATNALFTVVWSLGWLVVSLAVAALLGAGGSLLYQARRRT